ncbi:hypothetical protein Btru_008341 [Bulinus truncatus]|nr:hypothetical protein Btru_008341 [Bulinus truncatus]
MKNRIRKDSNDRILPQVQLDTDVIKKKLRRWSSAKKIAYAATILFITILIYASTSSDEYVQETSREWLLPVVAHNNFPVDPNLYEPIQRLPLGPFQENLPPVVIDTGEGKVQPELSLSAKLSKAIGPLAGKSVNVSKLGNPAVPKSANSQIVDSSVNVSGSSNSAGKKLSAPVNGDAGQSASLAAKPTSRAPIGHPTALGPAKAVPDLTKTGLEMARRLNHTRTMCEYLKVPNDVETDIYSLPQFNLSYCKVPKAGCTYWEQLFSFLNKNPLQISLLGIRTPFQISRYDIRYTSHLNLPRKNFKSPEDQLEVMKSARVLFVRHPLERLWSCYLEKFFLIDFWTSAALSMKTTGADIRCPRSVTFREFIEYSLPLFNEHWAPITELCNPCVFQPNIIGHVETMRDDIHFILTQAKLDWILSEQDRISREENQMLDMIIYNYQIHSINWYNFYHRCLSQKDLAAKLWDVFKKVGYLSSHAALPVNLTDYNQTTIIRELKSQYRKYPLASVHGRAQQLKMMKRDYDALPKPLMVKILEKYSTDFVLFGYDASVPTS